MTMYLANYAADTVLNHTLNTDSGYNVFANTPPGKRIRFFCLLYKELSEESKNKLLSALQANSILKQFYSKYVIIAKSCMYEKGNIVALVLSDPELLAYFNKVGIKIEPTDTVEIVATKINAQIDTMIALFNTNPQDIMNMVTETMKTMIPHKGGKRSKKSRKKRKSKCKRTHYS